MSAGHDHGTVTTHRGLVYEPTALPETASRAQQKRPLLGVAGRGQALAEASDSRQLSDVTTRSGARSWSGTEPLLLVAHSGR